MTFYYLDKILSKPRDAEVRQEETNLYVTLIAPIFA